jgi:hypothetical protein
MFDYRYCLHAKQGKKGWEMIIDSVQERPDIRYWSGNYREDAGNETASFRPKAMIAQNKNEKS